MQNCVFYHQFPVHPHCVVICASGAAREKKRKKTPPNEIVQHTDHAISGLNNVLLFWFVINTKFKQRRLDGNKQGEKKADHSRDPKKVKSSQRRKLETKFVFDLKQIQSSNKGILARVRKGERKKTHRHTPSNGQFLSSTPVC